MLNLDNNIGVINIVKRFVFLIFLLLFINCSYSQGVVNGPSSAATNTVPTFSTGGKRIQATPVTINPSTGDVVVPGSVGINGSIAASNLISLDSNNHVPGNYLDASQQTLTFTGVSTNITLNLSSNRVFFLILTTNAYFLQPVAFTNGVTFIIHLKQDSIGTRTVNFDTAYWKFPAGTNSSPMTTNANAWDIITCVTDPYGTNIAVIQTSDFR